MPSAPLQTPPTPAVLPPLLYVAPQMPMLPCNSCLTMCPTKCCHPTEGRGSEEEGGSEWERREGAEFWMGGTRSWILISLFHSKKELPMSTWWPQFLLCTNYQCVIIIFYCTLAHSLFLFLSPSVWLFLRVSLLIWFWIWSRWWPVPIFPPPPGHRKPWKQSGEGGNHSCGAPSYWCSRLAARLVTNNQKGLHSNSRTWREGIFKCKHWSNMSGAGSRLDPVTEQNGGPGWCAAILEQNILSMHAMSPNYVEISSLNCSAKKWQQNDLEQQRQLTK